MRAASPHVAIPPTVTPSQDPLGHTNRSTDRSTNRIRSAARELRVIR